MEIIKLIRCYHCAIRGEPEDIFDPLLFKDEEEFARHLQWAHPELQEEQYGEE